MSFNNMHINRLVYEMSLLRLGLPKSFVKNSFLQNGANCNHHNIEETCTSHKFLSKNMMSCHAAAIIKPLKRNMFNVISMGQNKHVIFGAKDSKKRFGSTHAEVDAIEKIQGNNQKGKRIERADILIIRINSLGKLSDSSPCINCLKSMAISLPLRGYKIQSVYHSNNKGNIECHKLLELLSVDTKHLHMTKFFRKNGFDFEKWNKWRTSFITKLSQIDNQKNTINIFEIDPIK